MVFKKLLKKIGRMADPRPWTLEEWMDYHEVSGLYVPDDDAFERCLMAAWGLTPATMVFMSRARIAACGGHLCKQSF